MHEIGTKVGHKARPIPFTKLSMSWVINRTHHLSLRKCLQTVAQKLLIAHKTHTHTKIIENHWRNKLERYDVKHHKNASKIYFIVSVKSFTIKLQEFPKTFFFELYTLLIQFDICYCNIRAVSRVKYLGCVCESFLWFLLNTCRSFYTETRKKRTANAVESRLCVLATFAGLEISSVEIIWSRCECLY